MNVTSSWQTSHISEVKKIVRKPDTLSYSRAVGASLWLARSLASGRLKNGRHKCRPCDRSQESRIRIWRVRHGCSAAGEAMPRPYSTPNLSKVKKVVRKPDTLSYSRAVGASLWLARSLASGRLKNGRHKCRPCDRSQESRVRIWRVGHGLSAAGEAMPRPYSTPNLSKVKKVVRKPDTLSYSRAVGASLWLARSLASGRLKNGRHKCRPCDRSQESRIRIWRVGHGFSAAGEAMPRPYSTPNLSKVKKVVRKPDTLSYSRAVGASLWLARSLASGRLKNGRHKCRPCDRSQESRIRIWRVGHGFSAAGEAMPRPYSTPNLSKVKKVVRKPDTLSYSRAVGASLWLARSLASGRLKNGRHKCRPCDRSQESRIRIWRVGHGFSAAGEAMPRP